MSAVDARPLTAPPLVVLVQRADYPAAALAAGIAGDVAILLHIAANGGLKCTVTDKSAPVMLRRPSCALVAGRWPYAPNTDRKGIAQPTDIPLVVRRNIGEGNPARRDFDGATPISPERWLISDDYPIEAMRGDKEGEVRIEIDVTPAGRVANCTIASPASYKPFNVTACATVSKRALLLPAIDSDGLPRAAKAHMTYVFRLPKG